MLKKSLITTAVLAAFGITSVYAAHVPSPYVGASIGVTTNTSTLKVNGDNTLDNNYRGVPITLFAGYGGVIEQNFYLAGELSVTVATATLNDSAVNVLRTTRGLGASIIPGVMLNDQTLAFARLGIVNSRFTNVNDTINGAQFGVGLQTALTQHLDLRGEYDYVAYRTQKGNYWNDSLSLSPRADQFNVGLVYKFD